MGVLRGLLIIGAIGLIAMAPCLVCLLLIHADELLERGGRGLRRSARTVLGRWLTHGDGPADGSHPGGSRRDGRLARWWQLSRPGRVLQTAAVPKPTGPPIEQLAGDLRRLNRLRVGVAKRSKVWFDAVQRAYDGALRVACVQLGIEQYLDEVTGVDLEVERLRVEGELQRAGLALRDAGAQQR